MTNKNPINITTAQLVCQIKALCNIWKKQVFKKSLDMLPKIKYMLKCVQCDIILASWLLMWGYELSTCTHNISSLGKWCGSIKSNGMNKYTKITLTLVAATVQYKPD